MEKNLTPLMRQYWDIKTLHQDKILLFRMGDFFELFFDDAVKVAPLLGIALTSRNKKSQDETPMCGVPHHSIAGPINKLLAHGLKIAICDQIEDPKLAKGIVKRAVTRVLTPGMVYDSDTLEHTEAHYMACIDDHVLACVDTTTGESFYFLGGDSSSVRRLLNLLPIAELVLSSDENETYDGFVNLISRHDQLVTSELSVFNQIEKDSVPKAGRRLISYILSLGTEESLKTIKPFSVREVQGRMDLTSTTLRHLEIFENYKGLPLGSLFHAINRTQTSSGARLLRQRLSFPLINIGQINQRLDQVQGWTQKLSQTKQIREVLAQMGDVERRLGKISQPQCHARDLLALSKSVEAGLSALSLAGHSTSEYLQLEKLAVDIEQCFVEEPPLQTKQGHIVRKGYDINLDELILLTTDSQQLLNSMELSEKEKTGISSLKIRYNNVFGYYIEVTHTHKDKVPSHYLRKQTLANAERYYTDELVELEKKVLTAQTRRYELEFDIFDQKRKSVLQLSQQLLNLASEISELDVQTSLAWLAIEKKYCKPLMGEKILNLVNSRHVVVEQNVKNFVPNNIRLDNGGCLLLTGPNMAGKSTIMRQVALTSVLAQMGSFVPAEKAELPIFEHLFTRIGASDQLSEGLSTFMVEMTETSEMIKKSNAKSLLILDEVGRGTSTFDGMSLAQAILEFILTEIKAITLFATHYHELTSMDKNYAQLKNAHMAVVEKSGEIHFLHTLMQGPAQKSYGIQVARLAGLPLALTKRAEHLLKNLEKKGSQNNLQLSLMDFIDTPKTETNSEEKSAEEAHWLIKEIQEFSLMNHSPLQVMNKVGEWQLAINSNKLNSTTSENNLVN